MQTFVQIYKTKGYEKMEMRKMRNIASNYLGQ